MLAIRVGHYLRRAEEFLLGMQLLEIDEAYSNCAALLAIHSAISYSDALRAGLGEEKLASDDHAAAVASLKQLLVARNSEPASGLQHLRFLLKKKSLVAYGSERLDRTDCEKLFTNATRFAQSANEIGRRLKIEGWRDDD